MNDSPLAKEGEGRKAKSPSFHRGFSGRCAGAQCGLDTAILLAFERVLVA